MDLILIDNHCWWWTKGSKTPWLDDSLSNPDKYQATTGFQNIDNSLCLESGNEFHIKVEVNF